MPRSRAVRRTQRHVDRTAKCNSGNLRHAAGTSAGMLTTGCLGGGGWRASLLASTPLDGASDMLTTDLPGVDRPAQI